MDCWTDQWLHLYELSKVKCVVDTSLIHSFIFFKQKNNIDKSIGSPSCDTLHTKKYLSSNKNCKCSIFQTNNTEKKTFYCLFSVNWMLGIYLLRDNIWSKLVQRYQYYGLGYMANKPAKTLFFCGMYKLYTKCGATHKKKVTYIRCSSIIVKTIFD